MSDVSPELLEKVQRTFERTLSSDRKAASLLNKIESGKAKYSDAGYYADEVGSALIKAFKNNLSSDVLPDGKMYWNIADKVVKPMYETSYNLVSSAAAEVQQSLNTAANIGLKAQTANFDNGIMKDVMGMLCTADQYDDAAEELYKSAEAWGRTIVDQTLKANIEFQGKAGRHPKIIRTAEANCCSWCSDLEGVYEYNGSYSVPEDVYRRHDNCKCSVEYDPGTGNSRQNARSKQWTDPEESAKIEERKQFGLNEPGSNSVSRKIESLIKCEEASYPPKQIEVSKLSADTEHINAKHNVTVEEALSYVENAVFSVTRWGGTFEDYFGYDGTAYVSMLTEEIRTAFKTDEFSENIKKILEDIKNGQ